MLVAANRCPAPPKPRDDGVAFDTAGILDFEELRLRTIETGELGFDGIVEAVDNFDETLVANDLRDLAKGILSKIRNAAAEKRGAPVYRGLRRPHPGHAREPRRSRGRGAARGGNAPRFLSRSIAAAATHGTSSTCSSASRNRAANEPPCRPVDLDALAEGVSAAFDPTLETAPARVRVLGTLEGLDPAEPLAPPEVCVGLERRPGATWNPSSSSGCCPAWGRCPRTASSRWRRTRCSRTPC